MKRLCHPSGRPASTAFLRDWPARPMTKPCLCSVHSIFLITLIRHRPSNLLGVPKQLKAQQPMPIQSNPATPAVTVVQSPLSGISPFVIVPLVGKRGEGLSIQLDQADWDRVSSVYGTRWGLYFSQSYPLVLSTTVAPSPSLTRLVTNAPASQQVGFRQKRLVGARLVGLDFRRSNLIVGGHRIHELGEIVVRRLTLGDTDLTWPSLRAELGISSQEFGALVRKPEWVAFMGSLGLTQGLAKGRSRGLPRAFVRSAPRTPPTRPPTRRDAVVATVRAARECLGSVSR
jgi:hypothetical protein